MLGLSTRTTALIAGVLLLGACQDEPTAPIAGATPTTPQLAAGGNGGGNGSANGRSSLELIEDDFADGLIDKNNVNRYREYAVSAPSKLPQKYRTTERGKDATYSMVQMAKDWASLSDATKKEIRDLRQWVRQPEGHLRDRALRAALQHAGRLGGTDGGRQPQQRAGFHRCRRQELGGGVRA